jgi:hypothetical protein
VRLRRQKDKKFKGSAFVEFESEEKAKEVAGLKLKFGDADLVIFPK